MIVALLVAARLQSAGCSGDCDCSDNKKTNQPVRPFCSLYIISLHTIAAVYDGDVLLHAATGGYSLSTSGATKRIVSVTSSVMLATPGALGMLRL